MCRGKGLGDFDFWGSMGVGSHATLLKATEKVYYSNDLANTAVDFHKRLRFSRGDLEPPRAAPCGVSIMSSYPPTGQGRLRQRDIARRKCSHFQGVFAFCSNQQLEIIRTISYWVFQWPPLLSSVSLSPLKIYFNIPCENSRCRSHSF